MSMSRKKASMEATDSMAESKQGINRNASNVLAPSIDTFHSPHGGPSRLRASYADQRAMTGMTLKAMGAVAPQPWTLTPTLVNTIRRWL